MSDASTIARPYARALFQHALAKNELGNWLDILNMLVAVVQDEKVVAIIKNPSLDVDKKANFISSLGIASEPQAKYFDNFIHLLATNKRLLVLPDILSQFADLKHQHEATLPVVIRSYSEVTSEQLESFKTALHKRFQREILLSTYVDPSLLGGAVIYAGDRVIDGSLVSQIRKLKEGLSYV